MSDQPVLLGEAEYRGTTYPIHLKSADRLRHLYMIGKTGVGKSTLFQNLMLQDIINGSGCCFVDPHGEAIDWLLERIPPERAQDVVLFDPADVEWPIGLNILEWHTEAEKDFLVAEAIQIFYKLFDPDQTGIIGPQFEHWMRNAALTVMADPAGGTLLEIPQLFTDKQFELAKRRHVTDKAVLAFWANQMAKTSAFHQSEMLNYFTSKFGRFLTNTVMRNLIGQKQTVVSMKDILATNKILLINLSKGRLGEINAFMLGLILMTKLQVAVLERAKLAPAERTPFYLYVDEFQNVLTDAFISMLAEARKYGLGVHLTNQYIAQLPQKIREAVLGNAATLLAFQIGAQDAQVLLSEFEAKGAVRSRASLTEEKFQYLPRHHFYIRPLFDGITYEAFLAKSLPPRHITTPIKPAHIRALNRLQYATPAATVAQQWQYNAAVPV